MKRRNNRSATGKKRKYISHNNTLNNDNILDNKLESKLDCKSDDKITMSDPLPKKLEWSNVENYDELLSLNLDFIHGRLRQTPYYGGPLLDPSKELIDNLDQLHRYGFLTIDGQETECIHSKCVEPRYFYSEFLERGNFYENEQRGYLKFHIDVNSFVDNANNNVLEKFICKIKESHLVYKIINMETSHIDSNIYEGRRYNVTRYRVGENEEKLKSARWINGAHIYYGYKDRAELYYWRETLRNKKYMAYAPNKILTKTIHIELAMPEYGIGNLERILIDMCKAIDLKVRDLKG